MGWWSEGDQLKTPAARQTVQVKKKKNKEVREMNTIITSLECFI